MYLLDCEVCYKKNYSLLVFCLEFVIDAIIPFSIVSIFWAVLFSLLNGICNVQRQKYVCLTCECNLV